jgi:hypothetical protein
VLIRGLPLDALNWEAVFQVLAGRVMLPLVINVPEGRPEPLSVCIPMFKAVFMVAPKPVAQTPISLTVIVRSAIKGNAMPPDDVVRLMFALVLKVCACLGKNEPKLRRAGVVIIAIR